MTVAVPLKRHLGLAAVAAIVMGNMLGSGVFFTPGELAAVAQHPWQVHFIWALSGVITLCGALTLAELCSRFPQAGASYHIIREGFGPFWGFLLVWVELWVSGPGAQVNYGVITDARGCPVALSVHEGHVADSQTFLSAVQQVREKFGIEHMVMVGDRGMIANTAIDALREMQGIDWITALRSASIKALVEDGQRQLDLFDERNLLEFGSPEYPGERLVACRNPPLARLRAHKREALLRATERTLEKIKGRVDAGTLTGQDTIGVRVGRVVNQYKVAKHFALTIGDDAFTFERTPTSIAAEAALDGLSIIRTSVGAEAMDATECVRNYKALRNVERAFRTLKGVDLEVRPIHHRTADRVRAHLFLCLLAYYVEWHLREAWRELMFADTDQGAKATRDPVAPATRSAAAQTKASRHTLPDGTPAHSFATLLADLATIVRNTCRTPSAGPEAPTFEVVTTPTATQQRAFALLRQIAV